MRHMNKYEINAKVLISITLKLKFSNFRSQIIFLIIKRLIELISQYIKKFHCALSQGNINFIYFALYDERNYLI